MKRICVVSGTRADYGLLALLMQEIEKDLGMQLQLLVSGMHLSPEFGLTYWEIIKDGFRIDGKVEMLLSSDTATGVSKSVGLGVIGFADQFSRLQPDLLILLGDRFEALAAALAAFIAKIPIAHIAGGDITLGALDDAMRHSITKMSHLHFVTNKDSQAVVSQLGEDPEYIFNVGSPGIDRVLSLDTLSRKELEEVLNFTLLATNLLITYHPETLEQSSTQQFREVLTALESLGPKTGLIFTLPNADVQGRELIGLVENFVKGHDNAIAFSSLGQQVYFSLIQQVDAVVGNSSSGVYEVPSFKKPTVNIGDRQRGRLLATSVISCQPKKEQILEAINKALVLDCSNTGNPYGDGHSTKQIMEVLRSIPDYKVLLKKGFRRW